MGGERGGEGCCALAVSTHSLSLERRFRGTAGPCPGGTGHCAPPSGDRHRFHNRSLPAGEERTGKALAESHRSHLLRGSTWRSALYGASICCCAAASLALGWEPAAPAAVTGRDPAGDGLLGTGCWGFEALGRQLCYPRGQQGGCTQSPAPSLSRLLSCAMGGTSGEGMGKVPAQQSSGPAPQHSAAQMNFCTTQQPQTPVAT